MQNNFQSSLNQSSAEKRMAAVQLTIVPCEPNTAYKAQGKPYFYKILSLVPKLCILSLKILELFCTFLCVVRFSCANNHG